MESPESRMEELQERYEAGDISESEYCRRMSELFDEEPETINPVSTEITSREMFLARFLLVCSIVLLLASLYLLLF